MANPYNYEKRETYVADAVRNGAITEFEHRLMNAITFEENAAKREGRPCQATPEELRRAHEITTRVKLDAPHGALPGYTLKRRTEAA